MPICENCSSSTSSSYATFYNTNCNNTYKCGNPMDATCVIYTGPLLPFLGIETETNLENALIKIDEKYSEITSASFSPIKLACLNGGIDITTLDTFASEIGTQFCALKVSYDAFVTDTESRFSSVESSILSLTEPNYTTCPELGIIPTDTLYIVDNKQNNSICYLYTHTNITGIAWGAGAPVISTIKEGFEYLLTRLTITPTTFNNVGTCLIDPVTTADGVSSTILNIRATLCDLKTKLTIPSISDTCLSRPLTFSEFYTTTYLRLTALFEKAPIFDSTYFTVTPKSPTCDGVDVTLNPDMLGKVKTTVTDTLDYLESKIVGGAGISVETLPTNQIRITNTAGGGGGGTVYDGKLTITTTGIAVGAGEFTANQSTPSNIEISVPPTNLNSSYDPITSETTITSSTGSGTTFTSPNLGNSDIAYTGIATTGDYRIIDAKHYRTKWVNIQNMLFTEDSGTFSTTMLDGFNISFGGMTAVTLRTDNVGVYASGVVQQLANRSGTIVMSVNGIDPDSYGNVVIGTGGGSMGVGLNLYNYTHSVLTGSLGIATDGGFSSKGVHHNKDTYPSSTYIVPEDTHAVVLDYTGVTSTPTVLLPDPSIFMGREIVFKFNIEAAFPAEFGGPFIPESFGTTLTVIAAQGIWGVVVKSIKKPVGGYVWEIMRREESTLV